MEGVRVLGFCVRVREGKGSKGNGGVRLSRGGGCGWGEAVGQVLR